MRRRLDKLIEALIEGSRANRANSLWLRGRDNLAKRYLVHVAGCNRGLSMRALFGAGSPKAAADVGLFWRAAGDRLPPVLLCPETSPAAVRSGTPAAFALVILTPDDCSLINALLTF